MVEDACNTNQSLLMYDGNCRMYSSSATWITWGKPPTAEAVPCQWISETDVQALGLSADDLARIHRSLNARPRKMLGSMTPLVRHGRCAQFLNPPSSEAELS
jgi:hypothetical protein